MCKVGAETSSNALATFVAMHLLLESFLLLVVMPGAPLVASLLLVAMPGAPSSVLLLLVASFRASTQCTKCFQEGNIKGIAFVEFKDQEAAVRLDSSGSVLCPFFPFHVLERFRVDCRLSRKRSSSTRLNTADARFSSARQVKARHSKMETCCCLKHSVPIQKLAILKLQSVPIQKLSPFQTRSSFRTRAPRK